MKIIDAVSTAVGSTSNGSGNTPTGVLGIKITYAGSATGKLSDLDGVMVTFQTTGTKQKVFFNTVPLSALVAASMGMRNAPSVKITYDGGAGKYIFDCSVVVSPGNIALTGNTDKLQVSISNGGSASVGVNATFVATVSLVATTFGKAAHRNLYYEYSQVSVPVPNKSTIYTPSKMDNFLLLPQSLATGTTLQSMILTTKTGVMPVDSTDLPYIDMNYRVQPFTALAGSSEVSDVAFFVVNLSQEVQSVQLNTDGATAVALYINPLNKFNPVS